MSVHRNFYDYYKELPLWAKGVVVVGGGFIAYTTAKRLINYIDEKSKQAQAGQTINATNDELTDLKDKGTVPSVTLSQAKGWADEITKQYEGCDFALGSVILPVPVLAIQSNSAKLTYSIFDKLKNDADFLLLVKAFDVRTYDDCGWGTGDVKNVTLYGAIADELNATEREALNKLLQKKGIKYTV